MSKSLYEVMFVLDPQKVEGNGEAVDAAIQAQLKEFGGEISRVKFLEKRTFARPMGKHKVGLYWDYIVELDGTVPAQIKEKYRLDAQVLRIGIFCLMVAWQRRTRRDSFSRIVMRCRRQVQSQ